MYERFVDLSFLDDDHIVYVENEHIRLGVNLALGGAITYLAAQGGKNLINSYDWGRQVQLSFYGLPRPYCPEGVEISADWAHASWNPISCGDAFGNRSKMLEYAVDEDSIYVKCQPMLWPLNNVPAECTFETWYKLNGAQVEVTSRINNARSDKTRYPATGQELPAVYVNGEWWKAVSYVGNAPCTGDTLTEPYTLETDCWPPRRIFATEHWSALVDHNDYGLGIWMPTSTQFGTGSYESDGTGGPKDNPTAYISPHHEDILDHNIQYSFDYALIVGTVEDIRAAAVAREKARTDLYSWKFDGNRGHFWYRGITDAGIPEKNGYLDFDFAAGNALVAPPQHIPTTKTRLVLDAAITGDVTVKVHRDVYSGVFINNKNRGIPTPETTVTVSAGGRLTGEGERKEHTLSLGLPVNSIGFELEFCDEGHARIYGIRVE